MISFGIRDSQNGRLNFLDRDWNNLFDENTRVSYFRNREEYLISYFPKDDLVFCDNAECFYKNRVLVKGLSRDYLLIHPKLLWKLFCFIKAINTYQSEVKNVSEEPLEQSEYFFLAPLHIWLCLMKNLLIIMKRNTEGFLWLKKKFTFDSRESNLSEFCEK